MSYERIEPIERSSGVDPTTRVVPVQRVGRREEAPDEDQQQRRRPRRKREPTEDDGRPHIDVLV